MKHFVCKYKIAPFSVIDILVLTSLTRLELNKTAK